jgi:Arylsulfotransferase (ASST)
MSLMGFYERNYARIAGAIVAVGIGAAIFFAGYLKGSPNSARDDVGHLTAMAKDTVVGAWQQTVVRAPVHFLQPARKPGAGVTINSLPEEGEMVLLTGFFDDNPGLRLIRRDGSVVASWRAAFSELLPERLGKRFAPESDWNIDLHGALIEPDGSVVFNFEYQGTVKLDRCGKRLWMLDEHGHHTLSAASGGGYWIGGRRILNQPDDPEFHPMTNPMRRNGWIEDDEILRVSADGKVLERKSVFELMMENGLEPVLTANGSPAGPSALEDNEILHLNKISELASPVASAFPEFAAGDLLLSIRDYNLLLVVGPRDWTVKWYSVGPWLRQHSAQFMPDGRISAFNNNSYEYNLLADDRSDLSAVVRSNIFAVDPVTGAGEALYGDRPGEALNSVVRGFQQPVADGGTLITETEGGRAFQVDKGRQVVWEYINRYNDTEVLEMTSAEVYPAGYFSVKDWSCP